MAAYVPNHLGLSDVRGTCVEDCALEGYGNCNVQWEPVVLFPWNNPHADGIERSHMGEDPTHADKRLSEKKSKSFAMVILLVGPQNECFNGRGDVQSILS